MDPAAVFRQSLGPAPRRPSQHFFPARPPVPGAYPWESPEPGCTPQDATHRVAHTLTACCRCRQRKTRCDATLPRCLPCERSGSTCEYYDSAKGRKINRSYVVSLQKKVRQLEAELAQYTDQEGDAQSHDDMVCPGGSVRLAETDEMPRYLGPSSGTAMTRLLMEAAKRFAESRRIANLIPEVLARRAERRDRMQSVVMGSISGPSGRNKSYPAHSIIPASSLPSREIVDRLVRAFNDTVQVCLPVLHEKQLEQDLDAVFDGDTDPYKHFVVNMVVAISMQKVGRWAGLPDSYYLNAMRRFEDVVRPQDLKTLQCLVLIGQYALMTPTRTAIYYVVGLATKICQQMGLGDERTIGVGVSDPKTLDMRRRLSWIITTQELGLAYSMGRPNGFAKSDDFMNVEFFETVADEDITPEGIRHGRLCERKTLAVQFCKMKVLQAEIRRMLYERKHPEPLDETHPWFIEMEQKLKNWLDTCPEQPAWCKPLLVSYYHNMIIALRRPSPRVPRPTSNAAMKCLEGSCWIIDTIAGQIGQGTVDINLEVLLMIYASLNALLWSISYPEVRSEHPREGVQELVVTALEAIKLCSDRWPGSSSAVQLYTVIADACLQSYNVEEGTPSPPSNQLGTPVSFTGPISPESSASRSSPTRQTQPQSATSLFNTSPFGYVFNPGPDALAAQYALENGHGPFLHQPSFRSNSIFMSPSTDSNGRRLSHLAPDSTSNDASAPERLGNTPSPPLAIPKPEPTPSAATAAVDSLPTPPESLARLSVQLRNISTSPRLAATAALTTTPSPTPILHPTSPGLIRQQHTPALINQVKQEPSESFPPLLQFKHQQPRPQQPSAPPQRPPAFVTPQPPPPPRSHPPPSTQQPPTPQTATVTDWFHNPLPPFVPPHAFTSSMGNAAAFWDGSPNPFAGLGLGLGLSGQREAGGGYPLGGSTSEGNWGFSWAAVPQAPAEGGGGGGAGAGFAAAPGSSGGPETGPGPGAEYYGSFLNGRHGSLSHEQQSELMDVLEAEGMNDIDSFLNMGFGGQGPGPAPGQEHGANAGVSWG